MPHRQDPRRTPHGAGAWVAEGLLDHLCGVDPTPPPLSFRVVRAPLRW
jgi:hypothetical protein